MMVRRLRRWPRLLVLIVGVLLGACGSDDLEQQRPPAAGERVALDFAKRLISDDWRSATELVSEEMPPTDDVASSLKEHHDRLVSLRPRLSGTVKWVGQAVLSSYSLQMSFEGMDDGGNPTNGIIIVRVRPEAGGWRVFSFGLALTEGVLEPADSE
jgi:hypothetical protein